MKNNFRIALRFIKANKVQTTLIALGIALGITVQLFLGLLIKNLNDNLVDKTVGSASHITINADKTDTKLIENYSTIINEVMDKDGEKVAKINPSLELPIFIKDGDSNKSLIVKGLDLSEDKDIYGYKEKLISGAFPSNESSLVIGKGISDSLNLKVGDTFKATIPFIGEKVFTVSGIADLNVKALNNMTLLTSLNFAQDIFNKKGAVTSIDIQVTKDQLFDADVIGESLKGVLPSTLNVTNWKGENKNILDGLSGQRSSSLTIQVFIIISVTISISGVLAISVMQKSKQIGILKAMGIKNRSAGSIFIFQGLLFGVFGALIGAPLGIGLFKVFTLLVKNSDGGPIVPGNIYFGFVAISVLISITSAVVASVGAAKKSLKLDPITIIRNN